MTTDDTDHLFDPEPYVDLKARNLRKRKPGPPKPDPPLNPVVSDGAWVAIARRGRSPHPYAHLLRPGSAYGLASSACGIGGRPLPIPAGSTVNACPLCLGLPVHQVASSAARRKGAPEEGAR